MKRRAGEEGEILTIHDCSDVSIISFAIAMAGSLADMKGVTPGTVGEHDRKRLSMRDVARRRRSNWKSWTASG